MLSSANKDNPNFKNQKSINESQNKTFFDKFILQMKFFVINIKTYKTFAGSFLVVYLKFTWNKSKYQFFSN